MKPKKCKHKECGKTFTPDRGFQSACSIPCSISIAREKAEKKRLQAVNKKRRNDKEKLKTKGDWLKEAQAAFNKYIRLRDFLEPCISCGVMNAKWDAGHFFSVGGFLHLRFNEDNNHKQCFACNSPKSGNIHFYRPALKKKIGLDRYEALEKEAFQGKPKRYSIEDAKAIKKEYNKKSHELSKELGI